MSKNYDNWERLVRAVLRKDHDRQIALDDSWESSPISSSSSCFSSTSQFHDDQSLAKLHRLKLHDQSLVKLHRLKLPMDHSDDLKMDHTGWKAFLPPDKQEVVFSSISMCFFLDQRTGKNCFLLGCLELLRSAVKTSETERSWDWTASHNSRFGGIVAEVVGSWGFVIEAKIKASMLSPETFYAAYLVFSYKERELTNSNIKSFYDAPSIKSTYDDTGYDDSVIESFCDEPDYGHSKKKAPIVKFPCGRGTNGPTVVSRTDGWMEVQMKDFYVRHEDFDEEIVVELLQLGDYSKSGLIVEGVEFRPETPITTIVSKKSEGNRSRRGKGVLSNFRIPQRSFFKL